jgi:hypothetical protein
MSLLTRLRQMNFTAPSCAAYRLGSRNKWPSIYIVYVMGCGTEYRMHACTINFCLKTNEPRLAIENIVPAVMLWQQIRYQLHQQHAAATSVY